CQPRRQRPGPESKRTLSPSPTLWTLIALCVPLALVPSALIGVHRRPAFVFQNIPMRKIRPSRVSYEGHIFILAFLAALPGSVCALVLLWTGKHSPQTVATLTTVIVVAWVGFVLALRDRVVFPLQTISNLLGALREGDYSVRGRSYRESDSLGEVMREVNTLGSTLREQRLGAL